MKSVKEYAARAMARVDAAKHQRRVEQRLVKDAERKQNARRNYVIGELVLKHFSALTSITPGTNAENEERFALVNAIIAELASDHELLAQLEDRAKHRMSL